MLAKLYVRQLKRTWVVTLGYFLLFSSLVAIDQSTKFHAEKNLLIWSDEANSRSYDGKSTRVGTWGTSPSFVSDLNSAQNQETKISANWVDFNLTYVRNHGAAWGTFSNLPDSIRLWGFYAITVLVSGLILYMFFTTHPGNRLLRTAFVFILAGAAGNFIDRVVLKYVIDWIHFHWKVFGWEYSFPVFNGADVSINIGMGLMLIEMMLNRKKTL